MNKECFEASDSKVQLMLFDAAHLSETLHIDRLLRHGGIETEVSPDTLKLG